MQANADAAAEVIPVEIGKSKDAYNKHLADADKKHVAGHAIDHISSGRIGASSDSGSIRTEKEAGSKTHLNATTHKRTNMLDFQRTCGSNAPLP